MIAYILILTIVCKYGFGETLVVNKEIQTEISNDTISIKYYKDGRGLWYTSHLILTNKKLTGQLNIEDPNDSSFLEIQIDTKGGILEIEGLANMISDTIIISDLYLIENKFERYKLNQIDYYRKYTNRDTLEYLKSKRNTETIKKGTETDTIKRYTLLVNDEKYSVKLTTYNNAINRLHFSGVKCARRYERHYKIFGAKPKRFIKFGGVEFEIQTIWTGELRLN